VPIGDIEAMSTAIVDTLTGPVDRLLLQSRAETYTLAAVLPKYLEVMGIAADTLASIRDLRDCSR